MRVFERKDQIVNFRKIYIKDDRLQRILKYNLEKANAETIVGKIDYLKNYGRSNFLEVLQKMLEIELPLCYLQFGYSVGTDNPHVICVEMCKEGEKIKVDVETSAIIRRFAKMYGIETYCFKSTEETDAVIVEYASRCLFRDILSEKYGHIDCPEKPIFRKVEETTEFLVVEFFGYPNSKDNVLATQYTGAVCIKIDSDIV